MNCPDHLKFLCSGFTSRVLFHRCYFGTKNIYSTLLAFSCKVESSLFCPLEELCQPQFRNSKGDNFIVGFSTSFKHYDWRSFRSLRHDKKTVKIRGKLSVILRTKELAQDFTSGLWMQSRCMQIWQHTKMPS